MTYTMPTIQARDYITSMTTRPYKQTHPYRPNDIYDFGQEVLRDMLTMDADDRFADIDLTYFHEQYDALLSNKLVPVIAERLWDALNALRADPYSIHFLSELKLSYSLCPVHDQDYAACFDDDEDGCREIRQYFPSHDT